MKNTVLISCENLFKNYENDKIKVLKGVNLSIKEEEKIAIVGASGSGKSTLLHLLGGLDIPSSGKVYYNNNYWYGMNESQRCKLRNKSLGFIYQFHHLLPELTALENTMIPLLLSQSSISVAQKKAKSLLEKVGLAKRLHHKPGQLSGGERQRVAIARALVNDPTCILADEPTGNLDSQNATHMLEILLNEINNAALILVTHDASMAAMMDRTIMIRDGLVDCSN